MKMISRKRFRKRIALFLLLVLFVPFIPLASVSADPLPVQVPDFPYGESIYHSTNTGSFALWQVHGSNYVSYVQTYSNVFGDGSAFPVVFRSGLGWTGTSYYYYINYEKIIDTWDIYGNHTDGFPGTDNIRIPAPNETTVDSDVYATLVYCTTDIYYGNGYGDDGIYAYQNFIVPSYADPTPTPTPTPAPLTELPTFTISATTENIDQCTLVVKCTRSGTMNGYPYSEGHYYASGASYVNNPWYYYFVKSPHSPYILRGGVLVSVNPKNGYFDMVYTGGTVGPRVFSIGYDRENNIITSGIDIKVTPKCDIGVNSYGYHCYATYFPITDIDTWYDGNRNIDIVDTARFELVACNYGSFRGAGDSSTPIATPTPTSAPTPIPQPSITPEPTDPPETGTDDNYTGLFGWLKRIRDAILNIPKKIVKGLVDALKYIFIPDIGKIKELFKTINDKFGINVPGTFEFDPILLKNPENVVMHFKPISLNGEPTEPVDITVIDFDKVDDWLETEQGKIMIRIIQAVFMLTMWGYMIYIFRKHVASINYTDSDTLEHSKYWH